MEEKKNPIKLFSNNKNIYFPTKYKIQQKMRIVNKKNLITWKFTICRLSLLEPAVVKIYKETLRNVKNT